MNAQTSISRRDAPLAAIRRQPLQRIRCLVPVWGYDYIRKFLEVGLPSWLADGNLPAISRMVSTEFVILTSREDELYLRAHPGFRRLTAVCETRVKYVDHLITGNNYSTTITLAYAEAVRETGIAMLDTCFMFLVSDYIVADGSFKAVIERVLAGRNGILVGNFQVVEEDALPWLSDKLQVTPTVLALQARDLMKWALSHLHPATIANTVDYPLIHNDHTNRLFWRVDHQTMIGRFYLMHMIAVRPEVENFVIGSSCDYSFIPEMCPSNNIEIITDSDSYLVIELQPRNHEAKSLKAGPLKIKSLAKSLSEWTTVQHRKNIATTVTFHAAEIPPTVQDSIANADRYLAQVKSLLVKKPKPHRNHPYWTGAISAFKESTGAALTSNEWRLALGLPNPDLNKTWMSDWIVEKIRFIFFGKPPNVRPWHPRYPDHSLIVKSLSDLKLREDSQLLMVADGPTVFTATFADGGERVVRLRSSVLVKQPFEVYEPLQGRFDVCLLEIEEAEFNKADEMLDRIAAMMRDGGSVLVSLLNRRNGDATQEFQRSIGYHASRLLRPYSQSPTFTYVRANGLRSRAINAMLRFARRARDNPAVGIPILMLVGLPLAALCGAANTLMTVKVGKAPKGYATSVLIRMSIDAALAKEAYLYSNSRVLRDRKMLRLGLPRGYRLPPRADIGRATSAEYLLSGTGQRPRTLMSGSEPGYVAANGPEFRCDPSVDGELKRIGHGTMKEAELSEGTREPQYNRCLAIKDEQGLTSLGLMTNQVWEDDPRRLTFLLARYKFVSKMFDGKKFVGELGCGDGFGTRIVMQSVEKVVAYDFDPVFIDDIRQRRSARWPVEALFHDILESPLPNVHDGIYSLDVIEHIPRAEEGSYIRNLRSSLADDGVLIIGSPSLESQPYASPPSKEGHINCKSGDELKALLLKFFDNVFLFSMNDEVVHTGYSPMAHYLFAICCQKKKDDTNQI